MFTSQFSFNNGFMGYNIQGNIVRMQSTDNSLGIFKVKGIGGADFATKIISKNGGNAWVDWSLNFKHTYTVNRGDNIFVEDYDPDLNSVDFSNSGGDRIGVQLGGDGKVYMQYGGSPPGGGRITMSPYQDFTQGDVAYSIRQDNAGRDFYRAQFAGETYSVSPGDNIVLHLEVYDHNFTTVMFNIGSERHIAVQRSAQDPDKVYFQYTTASGQQVGRIEVKVKYEDREYVIQDIMNQNPGKLFFNHYFVNEGLIEVVRDGEAISIVGYDTSDEIYFKDVDWFRGGRVGYRFLNDNSDQLRLMYNGGAGSGGAEVVVDSFSMSAADILESVKAENPDVVFFAF